MKNFIVSIAIFGVIIFAIDRVAYSLIQTQRPSDYDQFLSGRTEFFEKQYEVDILILGDSHITDALDPRIIEERLNIKSYNLGVYHSSPFENYYLLKSALSHLNTKPKMIVLGTNPVMFERNLSRGKYTPLIVGYDFGLILNSQEGLDKTFFFKSLQENYLFKYIYNSLRGINYKPTREVISLYNGHLEFYNQTMNLNWANSDLAHKKANIQKDQVYYFQKTIDLIKSQNIEVVIVNPPIWEQDYNYMLKSESFQEFSKILNDTKFKYNIDIFEAEKDSYSLLFEKRDYLNTQHLNYNGAKKFTEYFCHMIEEEKEDFFK